MMNGSSAGVLGSSPLPLIHHIIEFVHPALNRFDIVLLSISFSLRTLCQAIQRSYDVLPCLHKRCG